MKNKLRIDIPKPCGEKYSSFTPTSIGGFCSSCKKEVIDFTSWSDERVKTYFKNLKGDTCGRLRMDQLKVYSEGNPNRTATSWMSFLFAGFLLLFSSRQVSAQTAPTQTTEQYEPEIKKENIKRTKPAKVPVIGTVTSREGGQVMTGVKVMLKGTSRGTLTNSEGKFALDLRNVDSTQFIVFSYPGFKTLEYIHNTTRPGREIAVVMERNVLEDVVVLSGLVGGVRVSRWYEPREIVKDLWWWLTGR